jgi:hypothetical protein
MKLTKQTLKQLINEVLKEELQPYEGADPRSLFGEIIRDYDFDVISDDGESGYAETPQKEYVIKYFNYPVFKQFELFHNGDEVVIMTANDSGKQQSQKLKRILKHIEPHKKQMNESTNEPSIPFELVGASPKEIASYIQKNYTMNTEQDNSDDYLVLVSPTNDRRLVAVDKYLYLVHRKKQGGVSSKVLVDLTKNSNEVIEKRINKILDLLEPYKK